MATIFRTKDRSGKFHPKWRFKFFNFNGKRITRTGFTSKADTKKLAAKIEAEQDAIRKGLLPKPKESSKPRLFSEVINEYLAWGESQGGRGGRPWSNVHFRLLRLRIGFWQKQLKLDWLADLNGILPSVEAGLRELQAKGLAGKTLQHYASTLTAFCDWAIKRNYLDNDPLQNLQDFDTTPKTIRRAPLPEEIWAILSVAPLLRQVLYMVAVLSGLRANELRNIRVRHLDVKNNGFNLEAGWTKGRKATFQPLDPELVALLVEISKGKGPDDFLFHVPANTAEMLYRDMEKAGVPKVTAEGKLDFHALRNGFVTYAYEVGANDKEAQVLARHTNVSRTKNVYARTRSPRLAELAVAIRKLVLPTLHVPKSVQQAPVASEASVGSLCESISYNDKKEPVHEGATPSLMCAESRTLDGQKLAYAGQVQGVSSDGRNMERTQLDASNTKAGREKCPTDVQQETSGIYGFGGIEFIPAKVWMDRQKQADLNHSESVPLISGVSGFYNQLGCVA